MMILKVFVQIWLTIIHMSLGYLMNIEDDAILYRNKSSLFGEPVYDSVEEGEMIGLRMVEARYGREAAQLITTGQTDEMEYVSAPPGSRVKRAMSARDSYYWPLGILPFIFKPDLSSKAQRESRISMKRVEQLTCLRFVPWVEGVTRKKYGLPDEGHLVYAKAKGCWSNVGTSHRKSGSKISNCNRRIGIHELSHALGVYHSMESLSRQGWVRVNWENIAKMNWRMYRPHEHIWLRESRYDLSSIMHYNSGGFRKGMWPTMTTLFTDLAPLIEEGRNWFYNFHEIVTSYKCKERYCSDFDLECVNDGYVTYFEGKCRCLCPPGLEHRNGCRTVIKRVDSPVHWPSGRFGVFMARSKCPSSDFSQRDFSIQIETETDINGLTRRQREPRNLPMCIKDSEGGGVGWQYGSYCLLADRKGGCPKDFKATRFSIPGLQVTFCCRDDGFFEVDINLPTKRDFILFPFHYNPCQVVKGMLCVKKYIRLIRRRILKVKIPFGLPFKKKWELGLDLVLCYYSRYRTGCGKEINLSKRSRTAVITSPRYPASYPPGMNCYWLVKGPPGSTIIVDFDLFDVGVMNGGRRMMEQCDTDYIVLRYTFLGQHLPKLCGKTMDHSFRTIENVLSLNFHSVEKSRHKGFRANFRLHLPEDHCYNLADKGATYRGRVNFTRDFQPCLPWDKVTECHHHTFNSRDFNLVLEKNYCRNPDNSFRPWCYTRTYEGNCDRNYCDVCRLEKVYDYYPDCKELRKNGFCEGDPNEALKCAKTCQIPLPRREAPSKCDPPSNLQDAKMTSEKRRYDIGDSVDYTCVGGTDTITRRCHSDGSWSPASYVCGACPFNWVAFNGACYRFFPQFLTQHEASKFCNSQDSVLSSVNSTGELEFIRSLRRKLLKLWISPLARKRRGQSRGYEPWLNPDGTRFTVDGKTAEVFGTAKRRDAVICSRVTTHYKKHDFDTTWCKTTAPFVCKMVHAPRRSCVDKLLDCRSLLQRTPNVCSDYLEFANQQCPYSCGVCKSITTPACKASYPGPKVVSTDGKTQVTRGKAITYECKDESVLLSGNLQRVCQANGQLSGEKPVCGEVTGATPNNKVALVWRRNVGYGLRYGLINYNLENTIHRKGEVTQWRFYSRTFASLALQIWRKTNDTGRSNFKLVGENIVHCLPMRVNIVDIPQAERIRVEQGDVLGMWSSHPLPIPWCTCGYEKVAEAKNVLMYRVDTPMKIGKKQRPWRSPMCATLSLTAYVNDIV